MNSKEKNGTEENIDNEFNLNGSDIKADNTEKTDENSASVTGADLENQIKELNDKYLRLYSDFDNYRKRTMKEKTEIIKSAGEDVFKTILPVIDDFERAIKANESANDSQAIKEGINLIFNKLKNSTQQKGLVAFDSIGQAFDPDIMEAITHIPAADESQKGKVVDEVEKGYKLGDKVIRFAKVIVAQ
ncbi:MAG: nucleotide exchange factor GrpE [Bacteroidota bacterium]